MLRLDLIGLRIRMLRARVHHVDLIQRGLVNIILLESSRFLNFGYIANNVTFPAPTSLVFERVGGRGGVYKVFLRTDMEDCPPHSFWDLGFSVSFFIIH